MRRSMARPVTPDTLDGTTGSSALESTPAPRAATPGEQASAPASTRFAAGDLISNRYRVERFIARGGMGEVYEATDCELRSRIALKCVAVAKEADGRTLAR